MHLKAATTLLAHYIANDIPAFMWGPPGVGKSAAIRQIAAEHNWPVIDFRASTRDPVALMGLPDISGDTTKWKVPDEFPQVERDGAEGVLFLDELNAAAPSMMAAMFGFVLERRVGDYVLPPGWRIIAAGNRQADRAAAQRMPTALANRFAHIDVDADTSAGHDNVHVEHFTRLGLDPKLIAFLRFRPALIHSMPKNDERAFPTPRSWEQAAKMLDLPNALRLQAVGGIVGEGAAAELEGFLRVYQNLPSLDLVLANPNSAPLPEDPAARFAITSGLARKVDDKSFDNGMAYMQRLPREFEIMFAVDAVRREPKLSHTQAFVNWAMRNQDVTLG